MISTLSCTIPRYDTERARRVLAGNDDASDTDAGPGCKLALMLMLANLRYDSESPPEASDADNNADVDPGCELALMLMLALAKIWRPLMLILIMPKMLILMMLMILMLIVSAIVSVILLLMLALNELTLMLIPNLMMMLANLRYVSESASTGGL